MQLSPAVSDRPNLTTVSQRGALGSSVALQFGSREADAEIHAYIAARDTVVAEAERKPTAVTLNRAFLANELVGSCLKQSRAPYHAQSLPEAEAARQRQRCETLAKRIVQLRARAAAAA